MKLFVCEKKHFWFLQKDVEILGTKIGTYFINS